MRSTVNPSMAIERCLIFVMVNFSLFLFNMNDAVCQERIPPVPAEVFFGNEYIYYQFVAKRAFYTGSNFEYFALATYSADYQNEISSNSMVIIGQVSYLLGRGFGIMGGSDVNSFSGFSPVLGPQHTYSSKQWLAVTVVSYFLNGESDLKLFGLYEFKPAINDKWSMYNRVQFIVNHSLKYDSHNKSYLYLRMGLKKKRMAAGIAVNFDWSGENKIFRENYGLFTRWEF